MNTTRRLIASVAIGALAALIGPRVATPQSRAAGVPFAYEPPPGFEPTKADGAQAWVHREQQFPAATSSADARVVLTHSSKTMSVDEEQLGRLTGEMAKAFEDVCVWTHRRHEMRVRSDGARVGLIEGDCEHSVDLGSFGLPARKVRERKLQLVFPDDGGTSIVTASYPEGQAATWEPIVEATIAKAHGVATRLPSPPPWMYLAFGAAGALLAWLAFALLQRKTQ